MTFVRVAIAVLGLASVLGLAQARSCGYEPEPLKGLGEPCTRTEECQSTLECRGGVCMTRELDAGARSDAAVDLDAGSDAAVDAGRPDAAADRDAAPASDAAIDAASM